MDDNEGAAPEPRQALGRMLRAMREGLGLSQLELLDRVAQDTGKRIDRSRLSEWENGRADPHGTTFRAVYRALLKAREERIAELQSWDDPEILR